MQRTPKLLNVADHSRDNVGLTYIYLVVSRRSGGVSVGINLNPNNACNWRCIYCQVPGLRRGSAPTIDLLKLEAELYIFLREIIYGSFLNKQVAPGARRITDIAVSGNGEPTSAKEFEKVINIIGRVKSDFDSLRDLKLVLITNGSLINRPSVQAGLRRLAKLNGEVWFKLDSVTREGRQFINNTRMSSRQLRINLQLSASLCSTWLQTCVSKTDGKHPSEIETTAYLEFIKKLLREGVPLQGVLLYGLARSSMQPEAPRLTKVTQGWMESFSRKISALGLTVKRNM